MLHHKRYGCIIISSIMEFRIKRGAFRFGLFLLCIFSATSLGLIRVTADSIPFSIENVEVTQKSGTATGGVTSYDSNNIQNNVVFRQVGDSVTYKIKIKNVSDTSRVIENIDSNYEGELFDYSFNSYAGDEILAGDSFDFILKTTYKKSVQDVTRRSQDLTIKFVFKFTDGTEMSFTIANPSTWDNISVFGIILALSIIGLLIIVIFHMRRLSNDKKIVITAILLAFACLPLPFVNAIAGEYDVMIANKMTLKDLVIVDYYGDDDMQIASETIKYSEKAADVAMPTKSGYTFDGWAMKDGTLFDFNTPVLDDLALYAHYTPIEYTVRFNGNGATSGAMSPQAIKYDTAVSLNENKFERQGYNFVGWSLQEGSGLVSYLDKQEVENMRDTTCVVDLFAVWEARTDTPYTVIEKMMTVDGDDYVSLSHVEAGKTDDFVTPVVKDLSSLGFINPQAQTVQIKGDGSTVVEYVYDRRKLRLTLTDEQYVETSTPSGLYYYGKVINLKAKDRERMIFDKWSNDDTDKEISITMLDNVTIGPIYKESGLSVVFSHDGACTFNGITSSADGANGLRMADNITGDECADYANQTYIDTGVQLYNAENAHKDFYVEFTIDEFDIAKNGQRATFFSATKEKSDIKFPGIVVRRNDNSSRLMLGVNVVKNKAKVLDYKNDIGQLSSVQRVRIVRKNDAICYAVNDGDYIYVGDNTPHNQYFETPTVIFGASFNETVSDSRVDRYLNGTLSGMIIRLGTDTADEIDCSNP